MYLHQCHTHELEQPERVSSQPLWSKPCIASFRTTLVSEQLWGFPYGSDGKESACNAGEQSLIPGLGRSLEEGNGNLLQYSCLENSVDRGAWQAIVHGITKNWT